MNSGAIAEALIYSRDGIAGSWSPIAPPPVQLTFESKENLRLWEPWVRASIFDFELVSYLHFFPVAQDTTTAGPMALKHLDLSTVATPEFVDLVAISAPTVAIFENQLKFVNNYADLRGDRAPEIMTQMGGAAAFLSSIAFLSPSRTPFTYELIAAAVRLANFAEMRFKHCLACRRPHEYSPQIQPMILTPGHSSFPSGHATETFISALVLLRLLRAAAAAIVAAGGQTPYADPLWGTQLMRLASRVAVNRTVAGVHFPVDSAAGALLGITLGEYLVHRCKGDANYDAYTFDGTKYPDAMTALTPPPGDGDFYWFEFIDSATFNQIVPTVAGTAATQYVTRVGQKSLTGSSSPILEWLWGEAVGEWTR
jgi:membrane-associated phospholipid phosphatase